MFFSLHFSLQIHWTQQQVVKRRTKRDHSVGRTTQYADSDGRDTDAHFNDPEWRQMWYLVRPDLSVLYYTVHILRIAMRSRIIIHLFLSMEEWQFVCQYYESLACVQSPVDPV